MELVPGSKSNRNIELLINRELYNVKFDLDVESDAEEIAYQIGVITREGARRVIDYSFDLAEKRKKKLTSVDKANVLSDIYGLWRDVFLERAARHPGVTTEFNFVDAITMWFVKNPEWFDVVVTPNMFGDIITDLGAMIQGGLGLAPGGNINPEGTSMFEPIHGSAPKYKGLGVANPMATIWAGSMLLDHIGEHEAAGAIVNAIEKCILAGNVTKDMGGQLGTAGVGDAIAEIIIKDLISLSFFISYNRIFQVYVACTGIVCWPCAIFRPLISHEETGSGISPTDAYTPRRESAETRESRATVYLPPSTSSIFNAFPERDIRASPAIPPRYCCQFWNTRSTRAGWRP